MTEEALKTCSTCSELKTLDCFYERKGRVSNFCRMCHRKSVAKWCKDNSVEKKSKRREWYYKNKDRVTRLRKEWAIRTGYVDKTRDRRNTWLRANHRKIRETLLIGYGHICACCGETRKEFLALDHINGDGYSHRKKKSNFRIYKEVIKLGFPKDRFRLLCHNCNHSIGCYGYCPHGNLEKS